MSIEDVLDDLYDVSYYWDTLCDCHFFEEDAELVLYLYEKCDYSYSQAILKVLCMIEDEVLCCRYGY